MSVSVDDGDVSHLEGTPDRRGKANGNDTSLGSGLLSRLFVSCAEDPQGSVHRAWGMTLIFLVFFFIVSVLEMVNLKNDKTSTPSKALMLCAVLTGLVHLLLGILGTFVLKRFPTSFSIGFFLGILVILANQNMILMGTFYSNEAARANHRIFANLGFVLAIVLAFFSLLLYHFKGSIVVGIGGGGGSHDGGGGNRRNSAAPERQQRGSGGGASGDYRRYQEHA